MISTINGQSEWERKEIDWEYELNEWMNGRDG